MGTMSEPDRLRDILYGLVGLAVGLWIPTSFSSADPQSPPRGSVELEQAVARLDRALAGFRRSMEAFAGLEGRATADAVPSEAAKPPGESSERRADPSAAAPPKTIELSARSRRLRTLTAQPTDQGALSSLVFDSAHIMKTHGFLSYADILAEFGKPSSYGIRDGMGLFHYQFPDAPGTTRYVSFLFQEGRVLRVDLR